MNNNTREIEIYEMILKLINETIDKNKSESSSLNIVSSLWIILFSLIILQKVFKYVVKPCYRNRNNNNNNNDNNINRDESTECIVV